MKWKLLRQILFMSKLSLYGLFLQCLLAGMLMANSGNGQSKSIEQIHLSLDLNDTRLSDAISALQQKTGFEFVYLSNSFRTNQKISLNKTNESLANILREINRATGYNFKRVNEKIYISKNFRTKDIPVNAVSEVQQEVTISGTVTSTEDGAPLPGVSILVKGTTKGTTTDFEGRYKLSAPENATLIFSFIGYQTQEIAIGSQSTINLTMKPDISQLDEVVVVGYGVQKKSDITGSVGTVGSEELLKGPVNNVMQGLQGKVAGVNVFLNSGSPTSSPRILIRGLGTINSSSSPLFVVDGVVMEDIQFLNPNDIESMEVLKDASATAIYGSRGANGVILVSTRKGSKTEGMTIGYDGFVSIGQLRKKMDLLNAKEWLEVVETGMDNSPKYNPSSNPVFTKNDPNLFDENGNPLYDTDWQKEATRTAVSHNHQLSIQQRGESSSYGAFLNYSDMEGIMLNNYLKRLNGKIAYEGSPKKWLTVGLTLLANHTEENSFEEGGGHQMPRRTMIEMPPIFPVKFPDGTWSNSQMIEDPYNLEAMANPVHVLETQDRKRERTQLFGNAYLVFHLADGLDFRTQFGFDKHNRVFEDYSPTDLTNISAPLGSAGLSNGRLLYWQQENFLSYNKEIGDHRFNGVLGLSWQKRVSKDFNVSAKGFTDDFFKYNKIQSASEPGAPSSGYSEWAMNSYFLRAGYTFKDKYMITLTGRVDGSSRFGEDNKFGFFPSMGVGWMVSNEPFLENSSLVDQLKLRASYGVTGSTEIPVYQSLATVVSGTVLMNGSRVTDSYVTRLANPSLEWEKTKQFDIGMEIGMLNNRIQLELDYYYKLTTDILLDKPIPMTTGFGGVRDNIASVSNKGIEALLTTVNIDNTNFYWESNLNFNFNRNTIEKLGENDEDIFPGPWWVSGSQTILRVGEPLSSFWGYQRLGVWGTDEADEAAKVGRLPGEAKRSADPTIIGNGLPKWTGSFVNTFRYKNIDLSIDLQFVYDVDILQQYYHSTEDRSGIANGLRTILTDGWTEDNQNTMVQQIRNQAYGGQNSEIDSHWVADGSYLRGNLFTLGYSFDDKVLSKLKLKKLRIYGSVQNAFVIHSKDFQGLDPEATSWGGNQWGQNIFFFQYPRPRTFTLGVNLQF
ncbi:SusC/RagA family TonB-linked outer membrane protein [Rapidithrix thailandica]|uniref:SusC/RagA family TonB-linked outer membrane protein n=1 Tax=Rapidithrix thailandica TaxID=413964 RepID=A0AAW9RUB2_9BACT